MNKTEINHLYHLFLKNETQIYNDNSWIVNGDRKRHYIFFLEYNCSEEDPPLLTKQEIKDMYYDFLHCDMRIFPDNSCQFQEERFMLGKDDQLRKINCTGENDTQIPNKKLL